MKIVLVFFILVFTWSTSLADGTHIEPQRTFIRSQIERSIHDLYPIFGMKKEFSHAYKTQTLVALSFYPELKNTQILFQEQNIKTTMKCIPRSGFIFRKRENRIYKICIDTVKKDKKGVLLSDVPFNAQIGVIGHELGHVVDYNQKSVFGVLGTGFRYLFPKYRRKLENQIDEIAIQHHLGWQVYDFSSYVINDSGASKKYLAYKTKYYYLPEEIKTLILKQNFNTK